MPLERAQLATSLRVPQASLDRGGPVVSLLVDPKAMAELDANRYGRGRDWERAAYLAFLEEGEVRFASGVGVRIHGGGGRRKKDSRGYRVYLRKSYGVAEIAGSALGPEFAGVELRRFVLRNRSSLLGNPLAFDLMRAAGVPAPRVRPAELFVNGERAGVFEVSEYIDEHFMEAHFGHRQFALVQTKLNKTATLAADRNGRPRRIRALPDPRQERGAARRRVGRSSGRSRQSPALGEHDRLLRYARRPSGVDGARSAELPARSTAVAGSGSPGTWT